jgi:tripartite-type tricarboxylate transporter receptor subunit TctC
MVCRAITIDQRLRRAAVVALTLSVSAAGTALAWAQDLPRQERFPARGITIVVPFATASGADISARLLAKQLGDMFNQNVLVDNKPGANGAIGAQAVARANNDGYTLLLGSATTNAANYAFSAAKLGYSSIDFDTVAVLGGAPIVLWVGNGSAAKTSAQLVDEIRNSPGKMSCGAGNSVTQVACEVFKKRYGLDAQTVLYKSNPQSLNDLATAQISYAFADPSVAVQYVSQNRIRAVAIAGSQRLANLPETATFEEQGVADFQITAWTAIFAPSGTPSAIIEQLNRAIRNASTLAESVKMRERSGSFAMPLDVRQANEFAQAEVQRWSRYVKQSGVTAE